MDIIEVFNISLKEPLMKKDTMKLFLIKLVFVFLILTPVDILFTSKMEQPKSTIVGIICAALGFWIADILYNKYLKKSSNHAYSLK